TFLLFGFCETSQAGTMYKCGNAYSQTPCGPSQVEKAIPSGGAACQDEKTKYTSPCIDRSLREFKTSIDNEPKKLAKIREQLNAKLPDNPPSAEIIEKNKGVCQSTIRNALKDPESARMKGLTRSGAANDYSDGQVTARVNYFITVNAKNS